MNPIKGQGLPWQGGAAHGLEALDELAAVASQAHRGTPRVSPPPPSAPPGAARVDPGDSWDDDMPLNLRRPRVRPRAPDDESTAGKAQRLVKRPKARKPDAALGPARDDQAAPSAPKPGRRPRTVAVAPQDTVPVDMDKPLDLLLQEWVSARQDASPTPATSSSSSSSSPTTPPADRWSVEQLADAIRRRVTHDNPKFKVGPMEATLWRLLELFGRLRGSDHERAVLAMCTALGSQATIAKRIGRTLVSHSERLGDQLDPTIRLVVRSLGEAALFTPQPLEADRKAGKRAPHGNLLDEAIAMRPRHAGTVWRAVFATLHERHDVAGIARVVQTAVRGGGSDWPGMPAMFEALAAACGQGAMPADLLERCAVQLLQPPSLDITGTGGTLVHHQPREALQALLRGVSGTGWQPAHLQALRTLWQSAPDACTVRARAKVLEPLLCGKEEAPSALASQVREALAAANGLPPDRLSARILGPFTAFLARCGLGGADHRSLVDILCANLIPALGRLDAAQVRAVLQDLAQALADHPDWALLIRLYEHLVREQVDRGQIALLLKNEPAQPPAGGAGPIQDAPSARSAKLNFHCRALLKGAIAVEPPLTAPQAQELARMSAASIHVTPPIQPSHATVGPHNLINSLAHREPALPPALWASWVLGYAQGLAGRADLADRLITLARGLAVDAARIPGACAEEAGRAIALGLGGPAMPAATARVLLDALLATVRDGRPPFSPRLLRPLLDGLVDGLGGPVMPDALRAEVSRAVTAAAGTQPRVADPGPIEELGIFRTVLGALVTSQAGSSSPTTTSQAVPTLPLSSSSSSVTTAPPRQAVPLPASPPSAVRGQLSPSLRRQIEALVPDLFKQVEAGASTAQPHGVLRELFDTAMAANALPEGQKARLADALALALLRAVRFHEAHPPSPPGAPSHSQRLQAVVAWIGRTARSLDDPPDLAGATILRLAAAAGLDIPGTANASLSDRSCRLFARSLATALEVTPDNPALSSMLRAMWSPELGAQFPTATEGQILKMTALMAFGLRRHLQGLNPSPQRLSEALAIVLDSRTQVLANRGPTVDAGRTRTQAVLKGLMGGWPDGIPEALATAAPMSLQRITLLMELLATSTPLTAPAAGDRKLHPSELQILQALTTKPAAGTPHAWDGNQAFRLSLAFALATDRPLMQRRLGQEPSLPKLSTLIDQAAAENAIPSPAQDKRTQNCKTAAALAHRPYDVLSVRSLSFQARVDLLCAMYELPARLAARAPLEALRELTDFPLPADLRLAGCARLVRQTTDSFGLRDFFTARRLLTEDVRAITYEADAAAPAQQDAQQTRRRQAVAHLREVYAGLHRLPLLNTLLAPGPVDPAWGARGADTLRSYLSQLDSEVAELRRPHQPDWVAQELLPIATQAADALRRALALLSPPAAGQTQAPDVTMEVELEAQVPAGLEPRG